MPHMRSTPLRLTVLLILIFSVSSFASFGVAYLVIRKNFDTVLEEQVRQSIESYRSISDVEKLRERLIADVAVTDPRTMILQYTPDEGPRISNVTQFPPVSGFTVIPETAIEHNDLADSYLSLGASVAGGKLIVAQTRAQVIEMGEIFLTVILISLLPTLAIGSIVGVAAARQARDKIEVIAAVLQHLTSGKLDARVPLGADDTEDLSRIGLAVNGMADAQEASVASLRQVSADIAHDLKTPIQRVALLLDQLAGKTEMSPDQEEIVDRALDETDRIIKTFQALLQIAQIEFGHVRERFTQVDLRDVCEGIVDVFGPAAEESGHRLDLSLNGSGPFVVRGDKHLLGQVLANLVENGLRHVPAGGHVAVELSRDAAGVVLCVLDDGPGIPESERENVLRRLYRLERSRTSEGNGLGLSMVAAVCDLHGARLALGDNGPGLVVSIHFPSDES